MLVLELGAALDAKMVCQVESTLIATQQAVLHWAQKWVRGMRIRNRPREGGVCERGTRNKSCGTETCMRPCNRDQEIGTAEWGSKLGSMTVATVAFHI